MKDYFQKKNVAYGRWGGEEFVAVCYDADIEKAGEYAEDMRKKVLEEEFKVAGKVTVSIGLTEVTKDDNFRSAFDRMDKALYTAKSDGRNCVRSL